jgi:sporulation protein YlmC with PRC-barrel domain
MGTILLRILFIGNSLTATNDLPAVLEAFARAQGVTIETRMIAFPEHSLQDHWVRPEARQAIASGHWDFVVLQQGPSAMPASRPLLREYVTRFDAAIESAGSRTALFMVWPPSGRINDLSRVIESYRMAADHAGALLLPVGDAWRRMWDRDSSVGLYGPDGFHPSGLGTYLAALVMFRQLTGRSVVGLPSPFSSFDPALVRAMQEVADEACRATTAHTKSLIDEAWLDSTEGRAQRVSVATGVPPLHPFSSKQEGCMKTDHDAPARRLERLSRLREYDVGRNEPDPRGWTVVNREGHAVGEVKDLLVDTGRMSATYLDVELDTKTFDLRDDDPHVLVPVERAHTDGKRVVVDDISGSWVNDLRAAREEHQHAFWDRWWHRGESRHETSVAPHATNRVPSDELNRAINEVRPGEAVRIPVVQEEIVVERRAVTREEPVVNRGADEPYRRR